MRKSECGSWNAEVGMRNAEVGMRNAECGMRKWELFDCGFQIERAKVEAHGTGLTTQHLN